MFFRYLFFRKILQKINTEKIAFFRYLFLDEPFEKTFLLGTWRRRERERTGGEGEGKMREERKKDEEEKKITAVSL